MLVGTCWHERSPRERFDEPVYSVQPTRCCGEFIVCGGLGGAMPSFFYATAAFSSPGMPDLLRRTLQVGHDFSRGCCSARDPRPLLGLI